MAKKVDPATLAVRFNREQKEMVATGHAATVVAIGIVLVVLLYAYLKTRA